MRPIRLALLEIKRFHTPLQRLALLFIVLVPLFSTAACTCGPTGTPTAGSTRSRSQSSTTTNR